MKGNLKMLHEPYKNLILKEEKSESNEDIIFQDDISESAKTTNSKNRKSVQIKDQKITVVKVDIRKMKHTEKEHFELKDHLKPKMK
mmetsp:Transcript_10127/g.8925  ORF Transcript_10127/g.8925 Transcript_10127/m.8925 type:complete len:86 (+) Transcript_10127:129-386(+)